MNNVNVANEIATKCELNRLLPPSGLESSKNLSSSAPCAISNNQDNNLMMPNVCGDSDDLNSGAEIEVTKRKIILICTFFV